MWFFSNCDKNVRSRGNSDRANVFLFWIIRSLKVCFSQFLWRIFTVPRRKEPETAFFYRPGNIYFFFDVPIFFRGQHGASKDTPGNAYYGDMLHHLRTIRSCFRFWVTSCLHHSDHGRYIALVNDHATRSESTLPHRKNKKRTIRRQRANARGQSKKLGRSRRGSSIWATLIRAGSHVCQDILR